MHYPIIYCGNKLESTTGFNSRIGPKRAVDGLAAVQISRFKGSTQETRFTPFQPPALTLIEGFNCFAPFKTLKPNRSFEIGARYEVRERFVHGVPIVRGNQRQKTFGSASDDNPGVRVASLAVTFIGRNTPNVIHATRFRIGRTVSCIPIAFRTDRKLFNSGFPFGNSVR
jgi:hypothetical protein